MSQSELGQARPFKKEFDELAVKLKALGALGIVTVIISPGEDTAAGHMANVQIEFAGIPEFTQEQVAVALYNAAKTVASAPQRERFEVLSTAETKH